MKNPFTKLHDAFDDKTKEIAAVVQHRVETFIVRKMTLANLAILKDLDPDRAADYDEAQEKIR